ncbi:MAG: hypothetical protein ACK56W_22030 [Pirellula sp.]|jgi:hypothetical protein|nr:hypothetical protein [Pirellula sp.]
MSRDCPERVVLVLRVPKQNDSEPDGFQRLRKLLKCLIRSYGMKCESIEPKQVDEPGREP